MATKVFTDKTFQQEIEKSDFVLVDFWAEWCGPCRMVAPVLDEISNEMSDQLVVAKVDIDENPESPTKYGVRSVPTLCLFKKGELVSTKVGALPKNALMEWIRENQKQ